MGSNLQRFVGGAPMKTLALLTALALCACQSCHPVIGPFPGPAPQPTPPDPWVDGAPDAAPAPQSTSCAAACAHLAALGCPEAKPTPKGASCTDVCQNALGSPVSLQPDCVAHAATCSDATACSAIP